jgi:hypothetical protein
MLLLADLVALSVRDYLLLLLIPGGWCLQQTLIAPDPQLLRNWALRFTFALTPQVLLQQMRRQLT